MPRPRKPGSDRRRAAQALVRVVPLAGRWIERLLAAHDPPLTVAQLLALAAAAEGASPADLAERAAVSSAAVSQLLAGLEDSGLLERARASEDRRRQTLALTGAGRAALASANRALCAGLSPLLEGLPPHEAEALARALDRLAPALGATPPPRRPPRPPRPRGPLRP